MDFLDPEKQRRSRIMIGVGYILIAAAIAIGTTVLLYQAYGFGFGKNGQVVQNGLVFFSSQPSGSQIYVNSSLYKSKTDTRALLPAGNYQIKMTNPGYRDWQRMIAVNGGDVQHFDYPFLFPSSLKTKTFANLAAAPNIVSQSPDRRWLLIERTNDLATFDVFDLKNTKTPTTTVVTVPATVMTAGDGAQNWSVVSWSTDNVHVLLLHNYTQAGQPGHEYIVLNRQTPANSVNVTKALNIAPTAALSLFDQKYDQYYVFDQTTGALAVTSLTNSLPAEQLSHILAFKSYGNDTILYVTDQPPTGKPTPGKVSVILQQGQKIYTLRTFPAGAPQYILNLATYSGDWYVAVGAGSDRGVYIYKNPQVSSGATNGSLPLPWRFLKIQNPTYASFSANTQFIVVENGQKFAVYDAENIKVYYYTANLPIDQPQLHATWMDGNRLVYISGGKLVVFDYDHQNQQVLQAADPRYSAAFDQGYKFVFAIAPGKDATAPFALTSTPLTIK